MLSRQTFTLREIGTDIGSYTKYTTTNFSAASLTAFVDTEFFLSANTISYGINKVVWSAPTFPLSASLLPTDVSVRWSTFGEPQTVEDGFALITNGFGSGSAQHDLSNVSSYQGNWMYYSLFIRYASTDVNEVGDQVQAFEKVASVSVLMPKNYNSVEDLWSRIPEYFRTQDTNNDLYNYLSIFGWDLDQVRTILDYMMVQRDPTLSSSFTLQYLMEELGTVITTLELGAERARNYMNDIINLRLSKGTSLGLKRALQSITGCRVVVDESNKKINIYPQRVNWAWDPRLRFGLSGANAWYSILADSDKVRFTADNITFANASAAVPFSEYVIYGNASAGVANASLAFNPVRSVVNDGTSASRVYVAGKFVVPVEAGDTFYFSADQPDASLINSVALYTSAGVMAASAGPATPESVIKTGDGKTYFKMYMGSSPPAEAYLFITMTLPAGAYALFDKFLLEKSFMGQYFDGYTSYGGWLRGYTDRSDYRWHNSPTTATAYPYTTYGIYTADAWRVRKTVNNIYKNFLPVNWMDLYSVVFDYLPSYISTPATLTLPDIVNTLTLIINVGGTDYALGFDTDGNSTVDFTIGWPNII